MRLNALVLAAAAAGSPVAAAVESINASAGTARLTVFSDRYKAARASLPALSLKYSHALSSRWSLAGSYLVCPGGKFSGYGVGVGFDSAAIRQEAGTITPGGEREVVSVPKWLFRGEATAGTFRYLDTLRVAAPKLGSKQIAPVEANLYGVIVGGSVQRFLDEDAAVGAGLGYLSSFATQFSVSAFILTVGYTLYY